jgi:predicted outer membrane repeat protein
MDAQTFYIDPQTGDDSNSGLTPSQPIKTYTNRMFSAGDSILFKRGSIIRDGLQTCNGTEQGNITYGAYGIGNKPIFLGSMPANEPEQWIEVLPSIWRFTGTFSSEVCNLIFNDGETCGNLRWQSSDLKSQGEWYYTGLGVNAAIEGGATVKEIEVEILYLFSSSNPGLYYSSIECALWGNRKMVGGQHHIVIENLVFQNGGVHGYQEVRAEHIRLRNCEFKFIGGGVWDKERKIRFGNAVEFWNGAMDVEVVGCVFSNIYDSGVTHQGDEQSEIPQQLYFRNNLFIDYGMAAYEYRGPAAQEVYFENNTCINAGGGFAMQGEAPPRTSEIYPQPMGHHVFIWLITKGTQKGHVFIRNNIFYEAPYGAAIYSIIDPDDEKQLVIDNNCYWQTTGDLLALVNNQYYNPSQFDSYQSGCGQDKHSIFADPLFVNGAANDYRLQNFSPCLGIGMKL